MPFVPGQDVAGVVEAITGQTDIEPGDRVYGSPFPAGGGFAELALVPEYRLARMPGRASFAQAAALVIGGGTAHEGLVDRGRLQARETVLITAAAGGVGSAAVQIAAALGARPLGVASPANHDYLRGLRASKVVDYHAADCLRACSCTTSFAVSSVHRYWHRVRPPAIVTGRPLCQAACYRVCPSHENGRSVSMECLCGGCASRSRRASVP